MSLQIDQKTLVESTVTTYRKPNKEGTFESVTWEIRTDTARSRFWVQRIASEASHEVTNTESISSAREALCSDITSFTRNRDMVITSKTLAS